MASYRRNSLRRSQVSANPINSYIPPEKTMMRSRSILAKFGEL
ncbi:hypothetical protein [Dubosiella newyorkensis]